MNYRTSLFFATLLTLITQGSSAFGKKVILLPATGVEPREFQTFVAGDERFITYSEHLENTYPSKEHLKKLSHNFEMAQRLYLSGQEDTAKKFYQRVADMAYSDDWKAVHQKILFISFLRLSLMEDSLDRKKALAIEASSFSPSAQPSRELFPKDFINFFRKIKEDQISKKIEIQFEEHQLASAKYFKINGVRHPINSMLNLAPGPHRISLYSDFHHVSSLIVHPQHSQRLKLDKKPLAKGKCHIPTMNTQIQPSTAIYYSPTCIKSFAGRKWVTYPNLYDIDQTPRPHQQIQFPSALAGTKRTQSDVRKSNSYVSFLALSAAIFFTLSREHYSNIKLVRKRASNR